MKKYKYNDEIYGSLPNPFLGNSPMTEVLFTSLGGVVEDDGKVWSEIEQEFQNLSCCIKFKAVCAQIGSFLGVDNFTGGYDEIPLLEGSEAAQQNPVQALMLAQMWQAADSECNYKAEKLGIKRPRWFYCLWDIEPPND